MRDHRVPPPNGTRAMARDHESWVTPAVRTPTRYGWSDRLSRISLFRRRLLLHATVSNKPHPGPPFANRPACRAELTGCREVAWPRSCRESTVLAGKFWFVTPLGGGEVACSLATLGVVLLLESVGDGPGTVGTKIIALCTQFCSVVNVCLHMYYYDYYHEYITC